MEAPRLLRGMQRVAYRHKTVLIELPLYPISSGVSVFIGVFFMPNLDSPLWTRVRDSFDSRGYSRPRTEDRWAEDLADPASGYQTDATPLPVIAPIPTSEDAHANFGSLVQALYGIEESIARGLWPESSLLIQREEGLKRTKTRR
ncbi:hypothetical protein CK203_057806 [Vitis vinifera]|uniref:Uncharacterized protein n=1 Tax=Vitis vinifera TaxID=29760 RepID=A0A438GLT1_VITVI|nr:hypothetical protein CK203_057806 [Vitis vinifera]